MSAPQEDEEVEEDTDLSMLEVGEDDLKTLEEGLLDGVVPRDGDGVDPEAEDALLKIVPAELLSVSNFGRIRRLNTKFTKGFTK